MKENSYDISIYPRYTKLYLFELHFVVQVIDTSAHRTQTFLLYNDLHQNVYLMNGQSMSNNISLCTTISVDPFLGLWHLVKVDCTASVLKILTAFKAMGQSLCLQDNNDLQTSAIQGVSRL
jgi:hypothetical protein